jgi:hypothetical protein
MLGRSGKTADRGGARHSHEQIIVAWQLGLEVLICVHYSMFLRNLDDVLSCMARVAGKYFVLREYCIWQCRHVVVIVICKGFKRKCLFLFFVGYNECYFELTSNPHLCPRDILKFHATTTIQET